MDKWIKKIPTMEYYLVIKKNKILPFETAWMDPNGIGQMEIDN